MNVAVISDVHGNQPALEAVLADIAESGCDQIWCLGDTIGYGASPSECVELIRANAKICLAGNHDLGIIGKISLAQFSDAAADAAYWSQSVLSDRDLGYLRMLEPQYQQGETCGLYHGSPRDPIWEYLLSSAQADPNFDVCTQRIVLVGHTHIALEFHRFEGEGTTGKTRRDGERIELAKGRWILNPGSVGQPRDGDPKAAWMELDLDAEAAIYHRVRYDIHAAAMAIRAARLPESLAERLKFGQ